MPCWNHGTPTAPTSRYTSIDAAPRDMPSDAPTSSAANVWPVIGTGLPGTGIDQLRGGAGEHGAAGDQRDVADERAGHEVGQHGPLAGEGQRRHETSLGGTQATIEVNARYPGKMLEVAFLTATRPGGPDQVARRARRCRKG